MRDNDDCPFCHSDSTVYFPEGKGMLYCTRCHEIIFEPEDEYPEGFEEGYQEWIEKFPEESE